MLFLYRFFSKHKKIYLTAICIIFAVFVFLFSKAKFSEDIAEMLPNNLGTEIKLFQNSPLSNKLFVVIESDNAGDSLNAAQAVSEALSNNAELNLSAPKLDGDFLLSYYHFAPNLWNEDLQSKTAALLGKNLNPIIEERLKLAISPEGMFFRNFIVNDPLNLLPIFAQELKSLDISNSFETDNGFISTDSGKRILLIFNYPKNALDLNFSKKLNEAFGKIRLSLPENVNTFFMGAPRYTLENNEIITKDVKRISIISMILLVTLFFVFLKDRKAVFIYFVPPIIISIAVVLTSLLFGGISGITVGFGGVLMGLATDYFVYVYYALKASEEEERFNSLKKIVRPVAVSAITSIITFSLLWFSDIGIFRQVAVFCAIGLAAAFLIAFFVAPFVFDSNKPKKSKLNFSFRLPEISRFTAIAILIVILLSAIISFKYVKFDISLDYLNTVSAKFERDQKIFEQITGDAYNNNEFLFVFGNTKEEALENNEIISRENKGILKLSALFPSEKTKEQNVAMWKKFWTPSKISEIKAAIKKASKKHGIKPGVFDNFYDFLKTGQYEESETFNLYEVFNPIITINGRYAFTNILPKGTQVANTQNIEVLIISNKTLQEKITSGIKSSLYKITIILMLSSFTILAFLLKSVRRALLVLVPVLCGTCVFFIVAAVFGIEVNLFGLFAIPLVLGLGIDYAIFMIHQIKGEAKLHPTKAVVLAASSTLIGFGSLMTANHKVLFIIGFMVFTGILTSILVSLFIVPAFVRHPKGKKI